MKIVLEINGEKAAYAEDSRGVLNFVVSEGEGQVLMLGDFRGKDILHLLIGMFQASPALMAATLKAIQKYRAAQPADDTADVLKEALEQLAGMDGLKGGGTGE